MVTAALGVLAVFVLTAGTGFFVAQEFAYVAADRVELSRQAKGGDKRAASAIQVMERLSFMLSAAQIGITVTGLLVGFIAQPAFAGLLRPLLEQVGLSEAAISGFAVGLGFVLATLIQMVMGELFPKNLALARAEPLAKRLARSTLVYLAISGPVVRLFDNSARWVLRKVGIEPVEELHHGATLEELGYVISESRANGSLSAELSGVLGRALHFSERTVGAAMVPRPDVVSARVSDSAEAVLDLVATHGHSHFPVRGTSTDEVVGVVGVRELMHVEPSRFAQMTVEDLARPPLLFPDSLALPAAVERMAENDDEFACVVDEYGGLAGIVTLEDIAEELIGDIADENDQQHVSVTQEDGWWRLEAGLRVDEAALQTGLPLPESGDYDTVAGMIVAKLGRFAEPGDHLMVDDLEITVDSLSRRVPSQVRVRRQAMTEAAS